MRTSNTNAGLSGFFGVLQHSRKIRFVTLLIVSVFFVGSVNAGVTYAAVEPTQPASTTATPVINLQQAQTNTNTIENTTENLDTTNGFLADNGAKLSKADDSETNESSKAAVVDPVVTRYRNAITDVYNRIEATYGKYIAAIDQKIVTIQSLLPKRAEKSEAVNAALTSLEVLIRDCGIKDADLDKVLSDARALVAKPVPGQMEMPNFDGFKNSLRIVLNTAKFIDTVANSTTNVQILSAYLMTVRGLRQSQASIEDLALSEGQHYINFSLSEIAHNNTKLQGISNYAARANAIIAQAKAEINNCRKAINNVYDTIQNSYDKFIGLINDRINSIESLEATNEDSRAGLEQAFNDLKTLIQECGYSDPRLDAILIAAQKLLVETPPIEMRNSNGTLLCLDVLKSLRDSITNILNCAKLFKDMAASAENLVLLENILRVEQGYRQNYNLYLDTFMSESTRYTNYLNTVIAQNNNRRRAIETTYTARADAAIEQVKVELVRLQATIVNVYKTIEVAGGVYIDKIGKQALTAISLFNEGQGNRDKLDEALRNLDGLISSSGYIPNGTIAAAIDAARLLVAAETPAAPPEFHSFVMQLRGFLERAGAIVNEAALSKDTNHVKKLLADIRSIIPDQRETGNCDLVRGASYISYITTYVRKTKTALGQVNDVIDLINNKINNYRIAINNVYDTIQNSYDKFIGLINDRINSIESLELTKQNSRAALEQAFNDLKTLIQGCGYSDRRLDVILAAAGQLLVEAPPLEGQDGAPLSLGVLQNLRTALASALNSARLVKEQATSEQNLSNLAQFLTAEQGHSKNFNHTLDVLLSDSGRYIPYLNGAIAMNNAKRRVIEITYTAQAQAIIDQLSK
ncbi:MAG: hypothetical protein PHE61_05160 [Candidatus Omnitrophica bacterium]|nr:hypothetical protein [Candidatus Omnitrophota bacterium]